MQSILKECASFKRPFMDLNRLLVVRISASMRKSHSLDFLEAKMSPRVVDAGMFKGIQLNPSLNLSHMFYADDAVFVGQWCDDNINILTHMLDCFYWASGLRINMSKSKIMGILVADDKVKSAATKLGCLMLNTPFSYLGTKVGGSMSRTHAWEEVIDKVRSRLSRWKMKTLSIGGRLTLLKSVLGSMPIFHMSIFKAPLSVIRQLESIRSHFFNGHDSASRKASWIKWDCVLAPKEKGGLGVSSLYALNRALMFKWVWRFYSQNSSLWARVMKAIHGDDGRIGKDIKACNQSCWLNIVNEINVLKNQGINFLDFMRLKLGNGNNISFWNDNWIGGNTLKNLYPRIYALENSKQVTVCAKLADIALDASFRRKPRGGIECIQFNEMLVLMQDVSLTPISDRWIWSLEGSGDFSVASTRKAIDDKRLPVVNSKTRWIKFCSLKDTYLDKFLKRFKMENSKKGNLPLHHGIKISKDLCPKTDEELDKMSQVPYASAIRSIMYAMTCTRPDVSFILNMVSRHQQNPGEGYWTDVKNILKYLRNAKDRFLVYGGEEELRVTGYCDASWQTDKDDSHSQSGWVFLLNVRAVTWKSSK
ncbi:hypothetical protein Tco_0010348 [Tanacetum coccineum]